jgi:hypothetical protein
MNTLLKNKKLLIAGGLVLAGAVYYFFFSGGGTPAEDNPLLSSVSESPADAIVGRDLLSVLAELKSTKIDSSIFNDPVWKSLKDFSIEIAPQPIGRKNPFLPFDSLTSNSKK